MRRDTPTKRGGVRRGAAWRIVGAGYARLSHFHSTMPTKAVAGAAARPPTRLFRRLEQLAKMTNESLVASIRL